VSPATAAQLGIGTAALGLPYGIGAERVAPEQAVALLRAAIAAGVRYIDTAAAYGDAESVVGRVRAEIAAAGVRVCTKVTEPALRARGAAAALGDSLARLGLERVDTVLLHSAGAAALREAAHADEFARLIDAGLARRVGVSTYGAADASLAGTLPWVGALQVEHSILNPSVLGVLRAAPRVEVIARSVLCKGLLTARRAQGGAAAAALAATLDALEAFARDRGLDLPALAIRYALDSPGVAIVLVGVSSRAELETALRAAAHPPLSAADRAALAAFDRSQDDASHPELWPAQSAGGAAS
jgi:aryl-alcohol dehydrogenase-like predicted oxidoreductase